MPTLKVEYQRRASTYLAPPLSTSNSTSDSSCSLSVLGSFSSTGPDFEAEATTSRSIPPARYESDIDEAHFLRPILRHMPSWKSFISHRSRESGSMTESDAEADDEAFDDAPREAEWETRAYATATCEKVTIASSKRSSRKSRFRLVRRFSSWNVKVDRNVGSDCADMPLNLSTLADLASRSIPCPLPTTKDSDASTPEDEDDAEAENYAEVDEFFTPGAIPSSIFPSIATLLPTSIPTPLVGTVSLPVSKAIPQSLENAPTDFSPDLNLDIFSPRLPAAPRLRGIMYSLPISPLQLPPPDASRSSMFAILAEYAGPTSVTPNDLVTTQILSASDCTAMPSLEAGLVSLSRPRVGLERSPRVRLAGRRLSAVIRPPILPSPTPPSLLSSPRALGTPVLSPCISPCPRRSSYGSYGRSFASSYLAGTSFKRRRPDRGMMVVSPSGSSEVGGLGFGEIVKKAGVHEGPSLEHVPTPGTFGLEGEAERRMITEGVNPYFA
ncbi:MAG: hypothetical protein TREMPRED_000820 [Tremellales sp. Tagirdzhanova-0007]|nr:MAG: hypothetical protein TREMPRED_000820 [Tremellales sp. Tagirdzhanova-0007]